MDQDPSVVDAVPIEEKPDPGGALVQSERPDFPSFVRAQLALQTPETALEELERRIKVREMAFKATIAVSKPGDWQRFGEKLHFQSVGCERAFGIWGMQFEKPDVWREDLPDRTYIYKCRGGAASLATGTIISEVFGARWSGDEFFDKFTTKKPDWEEWKQWTPEQQLEWRMAHRLPVNPADVEKAARTNWQMNAFTRVAGLRGLTIEDLKEAGFRGADKIKGFSFNTGSKGGSSGNTYPPFGPEDARGKEPKDCTDDALAWWKRTLEQQIAKPEAAKFKAKNQRMLELTEDEIAKRAMG